MCVGCRAVHVSRGVVVGVATACVANTRIEDNAWNGCCGDVDSYGEVTMSGDVFTSDGSLAGAAGAGVEYNVEVGGGGLGGGGIGGRQSPNTNPDNGQANTGGGGGGEDSGTGGFGGFGVVMLRYRTA